MREQRQNYTRQVGGTDEVQEGRARLRRAGRGGKISKRSSEGMGAMGNVNVWEEEEEKEEERIEKSWIKAFSRARI